MPIFYIISVAMSQWLPVPELPAGDKTSSFWLTGFRCSLPGFSVFFFCYLIYSYHFPFRLLAVRFFEHVTVDVFHQRLNFAIFLYKTGYFCFLFFHRMSASCAFYVLSAKVTYYSPLSSRVVTSFIGTMGESDSSMVFVLFILTIALADITV